MSGRYSLRLRQRGNASVDNDDDANNDAAPSVAAAASTAVGRTALGNISNREGNEEGNNTRDKIMMRNMNLTFIFFICTFAILLVSKKLYREMDCYNIKVLEKEEDRTIKALRDDKDEDEEDNNKRIGEDYLRCESHGQTSIESSMANLTSNVPIPEYQLQPQLLIEAESCAAAFYALSQKDKRHHEQQHKGIFGSNSTLLDDIARIFTSMGIMDLQKNNLRQAQHYFSKAVRISTNSNEAKWHLSQLPEEFTTLPDVTRQSVLCCAAKDEEAYIDEWTDYHLGIGFGKIIVYDNTDGHHLKQWGMRRGSNDIDVIHFPGPGRQKAAYLDCAKRVLNGMYGNRTWAGFWDVDEFLVMRQHNNVDDFLQDHLSSGALGVNWFLFGANGMTIYRPLPVTKRFVYRAQANQHIKSLVRLSDMNIAKEPHVHYPRLKPGKHQHDTNGKQFEGPFNKDLPTDIAVLHHYVTKSHQEYVRKSVRGRADLGDWNPNKQSSEYKARRDDAMANFNKALANGTIGGEVGETFDDSAWTILKEVAPKYALYDSFDQTAFDLGQTLPSQK